MLPIPDGCLTQPVEKARANRNKRGGHPSYIQLFLDNGRKRFQNPEDQAGVDGREISSLCEWIGRFLLYEGGHNLYRSLLAT